MALWDTAGFPTNELANTINKLHDKKAIPQVIKAVPMLDALFGKRDTTNNTRAMRVGKTVDNVHGKNYEFKLLGSLPTITTVADGSAELASATINYDADIQAAVECAVAHYAYTHGVPGSEYDRFKGNEAKTYDWIDEVKDYIQGGWEDSLQIEFHATSAPDRTHFGGWQVPVDSSTTYLGLLRASDNADFRAYEAVGGLVTVKKIQAAKNAVRVRKGMLTVGCAELTMFTHLQQLAQGYSQAVASTTKSEWGADGVAIGGIEWILDDYTTDGVMGMFDPRAWVLIRDKGALFTEKGLVWNFLARDGYVLPTKSWLQNVCVRPQWNAKLTGCTDA